MVAILEVEGERVVTRGVELTDDVIDITDMMDQLINEEPVVLERDFDGDTFSLLQALFDG